MSLRINQNIASINGHRNLLNNNQAVQKSLEKLSSGLRINKAADDAAGLVISEQMRAQITGLNQAIDNSETAVAMVQTAEGALDEVNSLLNKARELVLHAANEGANDTNQLQADQAELDNVIASISRIGEFTQFGTKKLLDGSLNGVATSSADLAAQGINRVQVGNLANNSAVSSTSMTLNVSAIVKESNTHSTVDSNDTGTVFSAAVTGMDLTGGQTLRSGSVATLSIDGTDYTFTGQAGGSTAAEIASGLNTAVGTGFAVTYDTGSAGFNIEKATYGDTTDFTTSMSFTRTGVADVQESVSSTITLATGANTTSNSQDAAAAFFTSSESDLDAADTSTSTLATGTVFTLDVTTATGGSAALSVTNSSGSQTLDDIASAFESALQTNGVIGSGATVSFADGTSGFTLDVAAGSGSGDIADFSVAFNADFPNTPDGNGEFFVATLTGSAINQTGNAVFASGTFTNTYLSGAASGATNVRSGVSFAVQINGQEFQYVTTGSQTVTDLASELESLLSGAGFVGVQVAFASGGAERSGLVGATGVVTSGAVGGPGLAFYTTGASADIDSITLRVDSPVSSGTDFTSNATEESTGTSPSATLNLVSTFSSRTTGVSGVSDTTISSTGFSVTSGTENPTVSLDYGAATGLTLSVTKTLGDGSLALSLAAGVSANDGFEDIEVEIAEAVAQSGGTLTFSIDEGAKFQVGANEGQTVGVTIGKVSADGLGRNVADSGVLESLQDLTTTEEGALLNGLTDEALLVIDAAIDEVTNQRGDLGAFQANTLETGLNSLRITNENLVAAESTIRDVDFAAESANFTRNNILVQSATAMLAQANQLPQNVLQLLG